MLKQQFLQSAAGGNPAETVTVPSGKYWIIVQSVQQTGSGNQTFATIRVTVDGSSFGQHTPSMDIPTYLREGNEVRIASSNTINNMITYFEFDNK